MVIDSHALYWWFDESGKLSPKVRDILSGIGVGKDAILVSAVTFWEFRLKEMNGKFQPKGPVREWPAILNRAGNVRIVDVSTAIWLFTAEMDWENRDPADRIIAATAIRLEVPVVTADEKFHREGSPVKAVW